MITYVFINSESVVSTSVGSHEALVKSFLEGKVDFKPPFLYIILQVVVRPKKDKLLTERKGEAFNHVPLPVTASKRKEVQRDASLYAKKMMRKISNLPIAKRVQAVKEKTPPTSSSTLEEGNHM